MHAVSLLRRPQLAEDKTFPSANGSGAHMAGRQDGLSGRPSCRIYPVGKFWRLELERRSGWLAGLDLPGNFRLFMSLGAAVGFAEAHGLDYRIIRPMPFFVGNRRRPLGLYEAPRRTASAFMRSSSS